ncbi:MAG: 1-acyl-sn-glycerol-3-phosphate acyltransferase [Oscillospiraceae bacterium]|jgi:1-acyl-sn-glycerol-3-phosphate acyltransferase|nr:1-acyl-sn-glycerol-3-phosphate acyltransferase [Oscillospiraceae bacterium]
MYIVFRFLLSIYFNIKYKIRVYGRENIPKLSHRDLKKNGGYVIASNHQNYFDPPLLAALVKGTFSFMAKKELFEGGKPFKWLITALGAFPVEKGGDNGAALDRAVSDVKSGRILIIFPEGKRSFDGKIARGKSGTALIAARAGKDILPACVMYRRNKKGKVIGADVWFGEIIPSSELPDTENGDLRDNKDKLKNITSRLIGDITALQGKILETNRFTIEEYAEHQVDGVTVKQSL